MKKSIIGWLSLYESNYYIRRGLHVVLVALAAVIFFIIVEYQIVLMNDG